tara:strand:- start:456 stop:680 length:225 start_codon:yes stop_codon:yes gene_type:complete
MLRNRPQVHYAHRPTGDIDYILKGTVNNAYAYGEFYRALISDVKAHNVAALLSTKEIKSTFKLALDDINFLEIR